MTLPAVLVGILVTAAQYIKKQGQDAQKVFLFGQESVYATYILAKMNMILHGFNDAKVERGDTFMEPKHLVQWWTNEVRQCYGKSTVEPRRRGMVQV